MTVEEGLFIVKAMVGHQVYTGEAFRRPDPPPVYDSRWLEEKVRAVCEAEKLPVTVAAHQMVYWGI